MNTLNLENRKMHETIGGVTLDYTWYSGRDLYSDGDEEKRLLELVSEHPETDFDSVIAQERNWAVLYHLSHVRENILGSLQLRGDESVLEIGAGCGAVTGALLARCGSLTCVDLSRRRSLINAQRHKDKKPFRILVGNFQDMEPKLPRYDLITLIGVFEYAASYIQDENPYEAFLRQVSRHLKPGGRIVIAIENRLGMKYFAGSAEDHTGVYFDGIENYPDERASARTFSRPALEKIFTACGLKAEMFEYPYPDYKLPSVIFSDAHLPMPGELRKNRWNFDRKRLEILNEDRTVDSVIEDGLYPQFANSFLVTLQADAAAAEEEKTDAAEAEAGAADAAGTEAVEAGTEAGAAKTEAAHAYGPAPQVVYTKFSDERDRKYALKTRIFRMADENGAPDGFVRKTACFPEGAEHVLRIADYSKKLAQLFEGTGIDVNRVIAVHEAESAAGVETGTAGTAHGEAFVDLELIDCSVTLEQRARDLVAAGKMEEAVALISDVCDRISSKAAEPFAVTESFTDLFGLRAYDREDKSLPVTDIDMVAENFVCGEEGRYTLIDYEWSVDFPVPLRFVLFRIWHYFAVAGLGEENAQMLCSRQGFSPEEIGLFLEMEAAWQKRVKGSCVPLREMYGQISPGFTDAKAVLGIRGGSGESEFVSTLSLPEGKAALTAGLSADTSGRFRVTFDLEDFDTKSRGKVHLRWDPVENVICRIRILSVRAASLAKIRPVNGYSGEDGWDSFFTMDPVYDIELDMDAVSELTKRDPNARAGRLVIEGDLQTVNLYDELESLDRIKAERDAYYEEMENLRRRIEAIRSTKAYKATEGLRRARNFTMARVRGTKMFRDKNAGPKKYQEWLAGHRADAATLADQRRMILPYMPKISILVPVYNTPENYLREMISSVLAQSYGNWELCIADASGADRSADQEASAARTAEDREAPTTRIIREYAKKDPRIRLRVLTENKGISENTNAAAELATGDYITLLDHDDLLAPDALFEVAQAVSVSRAPVLYTDEDKVNMMGTDHFEPNLKPEFSPDLLRSHNYITHLFVVRRSLFECVGRFDSRFDGAQDYDLILRCTEKACRNGESIVHIPKILYHWRSHESSTAQNPESKLYAYEAGRAAVEAHLKRLGIRAKVKQSGYWGINRVLYPVRRDTFVSVIIPNKDHVKDLDRCLTSIFEKSTFRSLEVVVVENNSRDAATFAYYEQAKERWNGLRVVHYEGEFNFSKINNFGVAAANGDLLLLLNNDTQMIRADSIREMAGFACRKDVGCVGAKLLYADNTVQHAGVILGFGGFAGHAFVGIDADSPGFMMRPLMVCNYSAVTAACLMVRREVYEALGGLNESYAVALNDVDFCLRARRAGFLNVYTPWSLWHHYESRSRGYEDTPEKKARLEKEVERFRNDWSEELAKTDPYYNPNFPMDKGAFSLY